MLEIAWKDKIDKSDGEATRGGRDPETLKEEAKPSQLSPAIADPEFSPDCRTMSK
jgi:hypothetical protein